MKRFLTVSAACILLLAAFFLCLAADQGPQQQYIREYAALARSEMARTGVPASITLAQGLLESNAGRSALASKSNNHFGIKCHNDWKGKKTYADDDAKHECFRVYRNAEASFKDHSDFLRFQDRYKGLFELDPTDYRGWAKGLKKAGYATDPRYAEKLIKIIEDYDLSAYDRTDEGVEIAVPETPKEVESPVKVSAGQGGFQESVTVSLSRPVYRQNGVNFVYALAGETYESIALSYNLFKKEILAFNDLAADRPLKPGEMVYIQRKKAQAAKGVDKYVAGPDGETMRDIAQRFGVREKSLRKMGGFAAGFEPSEGDTILLRKKK